MGLLSKLFNRNKPEINLETTIREDMNNKFIVPEKYNADRIWACNQYINRYMESIHIDSNDEHLNNWNKGRLHAYNTLLLKLKELNSAEILEFAKCEAESVRLGEYSAFNSGMYEVYRTFSTIDMKQLVQSERLKTKPKYNN